MRKTLPINLQLFADGGDGNGDQNAGGDNGQAGQQSGQNNQQTAGVDYDKIQACLLYTSPSPRDGLLSRMPSSA